MGEPARALGRLAASRAASLGSKIDQKRRAIEQKKGRERVLSTTVTRYSRKIGSLQSDITVLQRRQVRIQGDLDAKRAELSRIQEELRQERVRLARLRARLAEARIALAGRLVELYKADKPDVVTVVLNSDGFADMLDRTEFMQRVSDQDARIIDRVRTARADAKKTAKRLGVLEVRQTRSPRRSRRAATRSRASAGSSSTAATSSPPCARTRRPRWPARATAASTSRATSPRSRPPTRRCRRSSPPRRTAPPRRTRGRSAPAPAASIWPVNGPIVSPFGMRWGRLHAGVDIAIPSGTPVRASKAGTVQIAGWVGGYGNYTCIGHGGGLSTCYGHQSSISTSVGAHVSPGPGHRLVGLHRPLLRPARALRDAHQRHAGQPGGLPVARRVP